ncbi:MAG: hypothetical protein RI993_2092 [Pseudomonadota bacterium]
MLIGSCLLCAASILTMAGETETVFTSPGKLCFPQTSLRAELDRYDNVILDHYVVISKVHHFKEGLVFVGFRLKSKPDELWLFSGTTWVKYQNNLIDSSPEPFIPQVQTIPTGQLQPIMPTTISMAPIDPSAYVSDGEIWIGYGLSSSTSVAETFFEMIESNRFERIWEIGKRLNEGEFSPSNICLTITKMSEIDHLVGTFPIPNETGPDIEPIANID